MFAIDVYSWSFCSLLFHSFFFPTYEVQVVVVVQLEGEGEGEEEGGGGGEHNLQMTTMNQCEFHA